MYDAIIVGAGPAGASAAVYGARAGLKILLVYQQFGGQAAISGDVENYLGFKKISGPELAAAFEEHVRNQAGLEVREGKVSRIDKTGDGFDVTIDQTNEKGKTVLIATGASSRKLNVPGEAEFSGKGVTYCATCDAPLFKNKDVAVVGGGNSALDAAYLLSGIASKVYVLNKNPAFKGDAVLLKKVVAKPNVQIRYSVNVEKISGSKFVQRLEFTGPSGTEPLDVQGVFVEIGRQPATDLVDAPKNAWKEILADKKGRTRLSGLFAAGDCSDAPDKQVIIAAGEGCAAMLALYEYLKTKT